MRRSVQRWAVEVQKAIDLSAARREFAGDDADNREFFDASMVSLIRTVHAELRAC